MNKKHLDNDFSTKLIRWFKKEKRKLPFRQTKDPYRVWLSEIILQQTQMETGLKYYKLFIIKFPDIKKLAKASQKKIYSMWQGLGYYNRAKNLHATAKIVYHNMGGEFPKKYNDLITLPGIGKYTAAAISSICFGERRLVVDANVYRVISRMFGVSKNISSNDSYSYFQKINESLTFKKEEIGIYNEAIMDFGGSVCLPKKPKCGHCLFNNQCIANKEGKQSYYPLKKKTTSKTERYFNYFIIENDAFFLMRKRTSKDIWLNLHEFYMLEEKDKQSALEKFKTQIIGIKTEKIEVVVKKSKGILSHQKINITFFKLFVPQDCVFRSIKKRLKLKLVKKKEINKYAVPKVIDNYLNCHS